MNKIDEKTKLACANLEKDKKKPIKEKAKRKKKIIIILTLALNFGILLFLKYFNFFGGNLNSLLSIMNLNLSIPHLDLILPLGISFYTLQATSYAIDVYRGKYKAEKKLGKVALFVAFFPQITEGPIGRFDQLGNQLYEPHSFSYKNATHGIQLIIWGFFKKMVIADRAAIYVNEVFANYTEYSGVIIVLAILLYTLQIYAEFSGAMNIVTGVSQIVGIHLPSNFERPFFSKSVQEFWRRWHITLGTWLKDYVFYSVSCSKLCLAITSGVKKVFKGHIGKLIPAAFALFFVWFGNGIWHGASWKYIFYGLYYYIIMMIGMLFEPITNKIIEKLKINIHSFSYRLWQIMRTTLFVCIGMLIFRAEGLHMAWQMFTSIFTFENIHMLFDGSLFAIEGFKHSDFIVILLSVILLFVVSLFQEKGYKIRETISKQNLLFRWTVYYIAIFSIIIFGIYGEGYSVSSFIYGQF